MHSTQSVEKIILSKVKNIVAKIKTLYYEKTKKLRGNRKIFNERFKQYYDKKEIIQQKPLYTEKTRKPFKKREKATTVKTKTQ
jgi:hypothetical protein